MKFAVCILSISILLPAYSQTPPALGGYSQNNRSSRDYNRSSRRASQNSDSLVPILATSASKLPVREVTIFKDGHAFFLHEGTLPVEANGDVVVPNPAHPVLGTFWPYALNAKLSGVLSSRVPSSSERTARSFYDLLKANIGARVTIVESDKKRYDATILGSPEPTSDEKLHLRDNQQVGPDLFLLQTSQGVRVASLNTIQNVIFKETPKTRLSNESFENLFRYKFDWAGNRPETATVGMVYLQRGLRWISSYRLILDGNGTAKVKMQATLVNNLADLKNVNAHLVIGVPSFAFADQVDPISLQSSFLRLRDSFNSANALSNAIQSQTAGFGGSLGGGGFGGAPSDETLTVDNGPSIGDGGTNEDFYVFDVRDLNLLQGERMVISVAEADLKYQDIFTVRTPLLPPPSFVAKYQNSQGEGDDSIRQSNVMHKLRLINDGKQPLTTAPALIESNGQLLAQTLMTYTAVGGRSDLDLAPAADVTMKRSENEKNRTDETYQVGKDTFKRTRIEVDGKITVTSFRNEPITVELVRPFVGTVTAASNEGAIRKLGAGDEETATAKRDMPSWWFSSSDYYRQTNELSTVTWTVTVPSKGSVDLIYTYNYVTN